MDPSKPRVPQHEALVLAQEVNKRTLPQVPYFETSSVTGQNVNTVFEFIFQTLLPEGGSGDQPYQRARDPDVVDLHGQNLPPEGERARGCC